VENLVKEFESLKNDKERWLWAVNNQDKGITVNLDNDDTFITFDNIEDGPILQFDWHIGWADGIQHLLSAIGIKADCV